MDPASCYAVPYHEHVAGTGRRIGLDAYFWRSLSRRHRVVLLVQPADSLLEEPPERCCRLPARVEAGQQVADVEAVAEAAAPHARAPRPSLTRILLGLLVPAKLLDQLEGGPEAQVPEEAQARNVARMMLPLAPTGRILWAVFHPSPAGALLPGQGGPRGYQALAGRDEGYLAASKEALRLCGAPL